MSIADKSYPTQSIRECGASTSRSTQPLGRLKTMPASTRSNPNGKRNPPFLLPLLLKATLWQGWRLWAWNWAQRDHTLSGSDTCQSL
jgi:hypothetical protein